MKITLASPNDILRWSYGEVTKPETINYRTQRPEKDGLFSERIFGPIKDWECYCGKYRRIRYKGVVCDRCGVEVTRSIVRRERMGHIQLAAPVMHIWFLRGVPSKVSLLLDVSLPSLEKVVYYAAHIVTSVNEENKKRALEDLEKEFEARKKTARKEGVKVEELRSGMQEARSLINSLQVGKIISENEYFNLSRRFPTIFEAGSGAEAIKKILENIDLKKLAKELKDQLQHVKDPLKELRILKRLKLVVSLLRNNIRPEWMVLTVLPVLPPDLRPMVALDGGRYATSDLNDLYRRVINRNNRLKKLLEIEAPEVIITNEKRMLQEAVDALIDNSARFGSQQLSSQRRPLRSLADQLKGKQGRFRQNLLGKRVDYSGRSVIVIGPELRLDQCGLPKKMALELFKPFVISKILEQGLAYSIRNANRLIEQAPPEVWAILEDVIKDKKVLLNRAPTLHRLGVQAFHPILIEDLAIRIPPMVCPAFNADFDGDQMAVHLPLSSEAQLEANERMLSSRNLLKPATGNPIAVPTQDIVLGCYYLTTLDKKAKGAGKVFGSQEEVLFAYHNDCIAVNAPIKMRLKGNEFIETSAGRVLFNTALPKSFDFINQVMTKRELTKVTARIIDEVGIENAAHYLDNIKKLGFEYATQSGITWGISDMISPMQKEEILRRAEEKERLVWDQYNQGLLTNAERKAKIISIWADAKSEIAEIVPKSLTEFNSIYQIINSGSRGSWNQPIQMLGMKGLVSNPQNETIELPIKTSLKEGHSVLEYFISTHGARKGTTDTALKTASAGYLTRRLVDVAQDVIIREKDCRTREGIVLYREDGAQFNVQLGDRAFSRILLEDVKVEGKIIAKAGEIVDKKLRDAINNAKVETVKVRSPITCKTLYGVCASCYGYDLGSNKPIQEGEAVGIVAAQSIGEPGTQLTMRTFHIGGVAGADITHGLPRVEEVFEARPPKGRAFLAENDGVVQDIEPRGLVNVVKILEKKAKEPKEYLVPRTAELFVKIGDSVKKGDQISEGSIDLKELFKLRGAEAVQRYAINEVQKIYLSEGERIHDKHIEIILRQMFARVRIKDPGDTDFIRGDIVEKSKFLEVNRKVKQEGGVPAKAVQLLMGITKVALSTESFLSAASFQETARILINAAVEGRVDPLRGLKENVIIGRMIPVGTGWQALKNKGNQSKGEEIDKKVSDV